MISDIYCHMLMLSLPCGGGVKCCFIQKTIVNFGAVCVTELQSLRLKA